MATAIHVTRHAIERYIERVDQVSEPMAAEALRTPAVALAVRIGAPFVRLPSGHRIVIKGANVVTVLPNTHLPAALDRRRQH